MVQLLNYRVRGEGQPVVLVHGLFGSLDNLAATARFLEDSYQVISLDLRNHGHSFHDHAMSYSQMASDVLAVLDHLALKSAFFVGHSMGGKVAMQVALTAPERVRALVVADIAPVDYPRSHDNVLNALTHYTPAGSRAEADKQLARYVNEPAVRQLLIKSMLRNEQGEYVWRINPAGILNSYDAIRAAPDLSGSYSGPVLFIKGERSDYLLPEHRAVIMAQFPAAAVRVLNGTGHWLHVEKPSLFNGAVKRFLDAQ